MTDYETIYDLLSDIMLNVLELEEESEYKRFTKFPQYQFDWLLSCSGLENLLHNIFFSWGKVSEEKIRHCLVLCRRDIDNGENPIDSVADLITVLKDMTKTRMKER